jgi:hypothetical protein
MTIGKGKRPTGEKRNFVQVEFWSDLEFPSSVISN